ncbi:MAG: asparagine synthase (glutamine-hydrolyzing) [Xanthomonadaceae bacterium]|nr:asparagine synthase (glutamine-hydrolyzing) [Xanthomonadaceae bacterium]
MCGIAGIVRLEPGAPPVDRARLTRMRDALAHRGPDDAGLEVTADAGFAHRRLSIIDIAGGHQPMVNADRTVWLVLNGEIYNFCELRAELEGHGCHFGTRSDTEVLLRAYEVFGERCVDRLRGMFAFAIWDQDRQKLFLARDRVGIKPLYYAEQGGELLFGSEVKALVAGGIRPRLDRSVLPEYLAARFVADERTFFAGVRKLMPGRTLTWTRADGFSERRYWRLPTEIDDPGMTLDECASEVRERLEDAVRCHLVSDVPVGLFLSGGLDSSGLAGIMAGMVNAPIHTFSVGFAEAGFSELEYARTVARSIGAVHRDVTLSASDFFAALPGLVWHEDEPIAFPSSVPLNVVSRLAQEDVKVVMTGEGADELFLGYNRYRVTELNERLGRVWHRLLPGTARKLVGRAVRSLPSPLRRYAQRSFLVPELNGVRGLFCENFSVFGDAMREQLLGGAPSTDPHRTALIDYGNAPGGTLERLAYADLQGYLVELLMKQDQMSMAASIESRVPFLDHKFVEFAAALPARYKVRGWTTKAVLRRALAPLVPAEVLTRKKMGFPVPIGAWLRGAWWPMVEEFVLGDRARERGLFDPAAVAALAEAHRRGEWNHGDRLWLLINLEMWQRVFVDGERPASISEQSERAAA